MSHPSIKSLYSYALAEGEGVGTAYEYYVKRRVLRSVVAGTPRGGRVVVAGLPEKYGTSLDFVLAVRDRAAKVLVLDEREVALDRARKALAPLAAEGGLDVTYRRVDRLTETSGSHELALSCEVVQRLPADMRDAYVRALLSAAPRGAIFVPNGENTSHTKISGLDGLSLGELVRMVGARCREAGFTDMPPFPPGITRSHAQRERAASGLLEGIAMWGLEVYADAEPFVPTALKRRVAHIAYAKWEDAGASGQ
jgi:hypothetical protein